MPTPSQRRTDIRNKIKTIVEASLTHIPDCEIFTTRGESDNLEEFVCIYFDEGDRRKQHSVVDTDAEIIIRISTKTEPGLEDERLDVLASSIEQALENNPTLDGALFEMFNASFNYTDSPGGNYSALELTYRVQYSDSE